MKSFLSILFIIGFAVALANAFTISEFGLENSNADNIKKIVFLPKN